MHTQTTNEVPKKKREREWVEGWQDGWVHYGVGKKAKEEQRMNEHSRRVLIRSTGLFLLQSHFQSFVTDLEPIH